MTENQKDLLPAEPSKSFVPNSEEGNESESYEKTYIPMMLGIMVSIAALLIPLHHKLEYWITHKLVEMNIKYDWRRQRKPLRNSKENTLL